MDGHSGLSNISDVRSELEKATAQFAAQSQVRASRFQQPTVEGRGQPHQLPFRSPQGNQSLFVVPFFPPHHAPQQPITSLDFQMASNWPQSSVTFDTHPNRIPDYSRSRNRSRRSSRSRVRSQGSSPVLRRRSTVSRRSARKDAKQPYFSAPVSPMHSRPSSPDRLSSLNLKLEQLSTNDAVMNAVQSIMVLSTTIAEEEAEGRSTYLSLVTHPFMLQAESNADTNATGNRYSFASSGNSPQLQQVASGQQNMTILHHADLQLETPQEQEQQYFREQHCLQSSHAEKLCEGLRLSVADRCLLSSPRPATDEELLSCHTTTHVQVYAHGVSEEGPSPNKLILDNEAFVNDGNSSWDARGRARTRDRVASIDGKQAQSKTLMRVSESRAVCLGYSFKKYIPTNIHQLTQAARVSAGCAIDASLSVANGHSHNAFVVCHPPGNMASKAEAKGFCYFNNVAVAAKAALELENVKRVMIVDLDLHHGSGTEELFLQNDNVLVVNLHRYDDGNFFPHSGHPKVVGTGNGTGYNINIAWLDSADGKGMGDSDYIAAFRTVVLPIGIEFAPDMVFISAGFDACHLNSAYGGFNLSTVVFGYLTNMLMSLTDGKVVVCTEGCSDPASAVSCATMCCRALLGETLPQLPDSSAPPCSAALSTLKEVVEIHCHKWPSISAALETAHLSPAEVLGEDPLINMDASEGDDSEEQAADDFN